MDLQPRHLLNDLVKLTPLAEDDFDVLYRVASDPLIWEQHPNPDRYKKDVFQNYFAGALASKGAFLISSMNGDVIGSTRFYDFFPEKGEVKIGYTFFSRTCWGMPYNRATKHLMLTYAFQFVPRVIFHVGAQNIRSQKAMEKLGAIKIGEEQVAYYGEETRLNYVYMVEAQSQLFTV